MSIKTINTLVKDIYDLFDPKKTHKPSEENLDIFAENLKKILRLRLAQREDVRNPLRFSSLGKPDRQLWYMAHPDGNEEELSSKTFFKFLYGDVIEQLVLFLCKEAGHKVELEQHEIELEGVKGHIDAIIDGVVTDVKSASPFGFKKFKENTLEFDDTFGYIPQVSGYANVITPDEEAAFLAFNKVDGELCLSKVKPEVLKRYPPEKRIKHLKEVIKQKEPPERCYLPIPDGKSGNLKLGVGCSYCPHKKRCWPGLRTFIYSTGPRFLCKVVKTPDVPEV